MSNYDLVGCRYCNISDWDVLTNGASFKLRCKKCKREVDVRKENIRDHPTTVYSMRYF